MKKQLLTLITLLLLPFYLIAMPGFESFIKDNSGEYVYYKDNTFKRESYIGILYYDESTLQIRYAAPFSKELGLPQKEIALLITIDPDSNYINMTGERIISTILPNDEDTDIVNYLHDILYEFNSRRSKIDSITSNNGVLINSAVTAQELIVSQDYPQFGDGVSITFDSIIPIFNIKNIINSKGEKVLECATFGQLTSSQDKSFSAFYGFPEILPNNSVASNLMPPLPSRKDKTPKTKKYTFENQSLILDEDWEQKMENFWTLQNDSLITVSQIPVKTEERLLNETFLLRRFLESTENSYVDLLSTELTYNERKCQYKIRCKAYQPNNNVYIHITKMLTSQQPKKGFISETSTRFDYFSISTYEEAYSKRPTYFEKIVKNYKSN